LKRDLVKYKTAIRKATPAQRRVLRRKIVRVRVITQGKKYCDKVNGIYGRIRRQAIKNPTIANKKRVLIWRSRYNSCRNELNKSKNTRRKMTTKVVVKRKVVRRAPKTVIRKYNNKINNLRKSVKKATTPAQRKVIRNRIIRIRVIKGGKRYISRCGRRINYYR
jgi:hypothetical protein